MRSYITPVQSLGLASGSSSPRKKASSSSAVAGIPFSNSSNGGGSAFGGVGSLSSASGSFSAANLPPVRRNIDGLPAIETRKCPVPGCDSFGHLGEYAKEIRRRITCMRKHFWLQEVVLSDIFWWTLARCFTIPVVRTAKTSAGSSIRRSL